MDIQFIGGGKPFNRWVIDWPACLPGGLASPAHDGQGTHTQQRRGPGLGDVGGTHAVIVRSGGARLNHFDGKLDELMIYARSLSGIEVMDLYNHSRPPSHK